jgi:hypothetical protein
VDFPQLYHKFQPLEKITAAKPKVFRWNENNFRVCEQLTYLYLGIRRLRLSTIHAEYKINSMYNSARFCDTLPIGSKENEQKHRHFHIPKANLRYLKWKFMTIPVVPTRKHMTTFLKPLIPLIWTISIGSRTVSVFAPSIRMKLNLKLQVRS